MLHIHLYEENELQLLIFMTASSFTNYQPKSYKKFKAMLQIPK